jgi:hypothetical protein
MTTTMSNPEQLVSHMQDYYGDLWAERLLLGVYHVTFHTMSSHSIADSLPPGVMDGLDMMYNLVEGLYGDGVEPKGDLVNG